MQSNTIKADKSMYSSFDLIQDKLDETIDGNEIFYNITCRQ